MSDARCAVLLHFRLFVDEMEESMRITKQHAKTVVLMLCCNWVFGVYLEAFGQPGEDVRNLPVVRDNIQQAGSRSCKSFAGSY